jgi:uncharacterized protein
MSFSIPQRIAAELKIRLEQVQATLDLLEQGGTVPFIARYRKEATGSLDEVQITAIRDQHKRYTELEERRSFILQTIESQGKLSEELRAQIEKAETLALLEDLYLPFKPKRRTRAQIAREKGLEPLSIALSLYACTDPLKEASKYVDAEKGVNSPEEALQGARDIIAEQINEDAALRQRLRNYLQRNTQIKASILKDKEEEPEAEKFKDYFDWVEPLYKAPSHRILAMLRGEKEGFLRLGLEEDAQQSLNLIEDLYVKSNDACGQQLKLAAHDAYKRLLRPSLENELLAQAKEQADKVAIEVFVQNLRELLMASPLGEKRVMAIDPGYRTGCKVVCLDQYGNLQHETVIYLLSSGEQSRAQDTVLRLVQQYQIEAIAIGNGTASRETEQFARKLNLKNIPILVVNESGASIYSASDVAREEFPDKDVTVRGAVSIGRRLMDPLAELVKIDPKSIGVGQYQHDVNQTWLKQSLDDTVMSCVNAVGVEINTASKQLLSYVAGLSESLAQNIVQYRKENGPFQSRKEILKVPRLGPKAFEQAAGFLRIRGAKHPLDSSAVHPERYELVEQMAKDLGCTVQDLMQKKELRDQINLKRYVSEQVGLPTLQDIMAELAKPGRDPRQQFEAFSFAEGIEKPEDLKEGMQLPGIVTNVTNFGAFVDVGVHQDGLVHISELADRFVKDPMQVVKVGQKVQVRVLNVNLKTKRISLSMKK